MPHLLRLKGLSSSLWYNRRCWHETDKITHRFPPGLSCIYKEWMTNWWQHDLERLSMELACTSLVMKASTSVGYRVCNRTALQGCAEALSARGATNVSRCWSVDCISAMYASWRQQGGACLYIARHESKHERGLQSLQQDCIAGLRRGTFCTRWYNCVFAFHCILSSWNMFNVIFFPDVKRNSNISVFTIFLMFCNFLSCILIFYNLCRKISLITVTLIFLC